MTKLTYKVTENNGGGLTLYVWEGERLIYGHHGYEHDPKTLRDDIKALEDGGHPINDNWDENDLLDEDLIRAARLEYDHETGRDYISEDQSPLTEAEYYDDSPETSVIYDSEVGGAVAYDDMGSAGQSAYYPDGDP